MQYGAILSSLILVRLFSQETVSAAAVCIESRSNSTIACDVDIIDIHCCM